ncbi:MAG: tetratricopeptide repeat protein [Cyclobacteriaceae bacterium]
MNSARIKQLKTYLEETPDDPFLHYALALEYQEEAPEKARKIFDRLLETHPDYLPAYYHAAHLYWSVDALEKARETFDSGIALASKKGDHHALRELQNALTNFEFETE